MPLTAGLAKTALVDENGFMTQAWQIHFRETQTAIAKVPERKDEVQIPPIGGSIPATPLTVQGVLPSGLYRVLAYLRIVVPAATSSSVSVTLGWIDGGVTCSMVLIPAVTGNAPGTVASGAALFHIDNGSPIAYSTVYASDPANTMQYELSLVLEGMGGN